MESYILFQVLTSQEEGSLKDHIVKMSKMFYGLDKVKVRKLAYEFAVKKTKKIPESWQKKGCAGEEWLKGFRRRVGDLSLRTPDLTSLARTRAFYRHNVQLFFDNIKAIYETLKPSPMRIWNLDETGVNTVPTSKLILCQKGMKQIGQIKSGERGINVTMWCCINAVGTALPPAYIFLRVRFKSETLRGAPAGSLGLANQLGWMRADIFSEVLSPFVSNMSVFKDQPGVLIFDNHSSHIALETIELARDHGLSLVRLPPHCSHKLQPLDVGVFGAYKRFCSSICNDPILVKQSQFIMLGNYLVKPLQNLSQWKTFFCRSDALAYFL